MRRSVPPHELGGSTKGNDPLSGPGRLENISHDIPNAVFSLYTYLISDRHISRRQRAVLNFGQLAVFTRQ